MDSFDAVAPREPAESDVQPVEASDQVRLLVQIANGLIAAHARIDVLEERLIAKTQGAVKSEVEGFANDGRERLAQLQCKMGSWVVEIGKTVEACTDRSTGHLAAAIDSSEKSARKQLTEVDKNLAQVTNHARSMTERQVGLLADSVDKSFERLDQRLDKAEQEQKDSAKRDKAISLRWRLVFLLLGLALLSPDAYQLYRFLTREGR